MLGQRDVIIAWIVIFHLSSTTEAEYRRVCYFTNWSQYGSPPFSTDDIDPALCSHVSFAFADISGNQLTTIEWNDEALYQQVNNIKSKNSILRTLLSVGGYSAGQRWSSMLSTSDNRQQFINSSVTYLRSKNFDGLDLVFEFPGFGNSPPGDKHLYTALVQELRAAFDDEGVATGRTALLLTAAVAAVQRQIDSAYDVPNISQAMDFISLLTYDYHSSWESVSGHNSPLFSMSTESDTAAHLNVRWSAEYWVSLGAPINKLVIGIPFYGRCFTLSSNATGFGAPTSGACSDGETPKYNQICKKLASNGTTRFWSADQQVPYLIYSGNRWLGYDDPQSVAGKANWSSSNGYGGWMVWSLDQDDFTGSCGPTYPLLKTLNNVSITTTPTTIKIPTTTTTSTTIKIPTTTTTPTTTDSPTASSRVWIPIVITLAVLAPIIIVGTAIYIVQRRVKMARHEQDNEVYGLQEDISCEDIAKPNMAFLRVCRESEIRRGDVIGTGAFGTVFKGYYIPEHEHVKIPVAIKELSNISNSGLSTALLDEAHVMASVRHRCCVQIVALCLTERPLIVVPLMPLGSLLDYLRNNKSNIGSHALLLWSQQIAAGMEYLEKSGIVHRDLAARNVLVQSATQVKITDFGLAKLLDHNEEGFQSSGERLPVKWLALESIKTGVFNHKTDVWSYGVTLWEMFTFGQRPFKDVKITDMKATLEEGKRLTQPSICAIDVYMIMIKCWLIDPESRPTFAKLVLDFSKMSSEPTRYLNIRNDATKQLDTVEPEVSDLVRYLGMTLKDDDQVETVYAEKYCDMTSRMPASYVNCISANDNDGGERPDSLQLELGDLLSNNDYVDNILHRSDPSQMPVTNQDYLELSEPSNVGLRNGCELA